MPPFSNPNGQPPGSPDSDRQDASFDRHCDRAFLGLLAELPEVAALFSVGEADGLSFADDALTDWSPAGEAARMNKMLGAHQALAAAEAAEPATDQESRRTRAVFREFLEHPTFEPLVGTAGRAFAQHSYLVCQEGGIQTELPLFFVNLHPLADRDDAERYLAKLHRVPATVRGLIESLRDREACALIPPRFLLQEAAAEIRVATRRSAACSSASRTRASRDSAFAIAVAMISANFSRRSSESAGSRSLDETVAVPQIWPSTRIGLATVEATPRRSPAEPTGPSTTDQSTASSRAERPVRRTSADTNESSSCHRVPIGITSRTFFETPTKTIAPSSSNLMTPAVFEPKRRPTSSLTAENTSTRGTPWATSVANRRSAACSSGGPRRSSARNQRAPLGGGGLTSN